MAVDDLVGDGVVLALASQQNRPARSDGDGNQDRGGIGEPAWRGADGALAAASRRSMERSCRRSASGAR
jgi:hypothetical protein